MNINPAKFAIKSCTGPRPPDAGTIDLIPIRLCMVMASWLHARHLDTHCDSSPTVSACWFNSGGKILSSTITLSATTRWHYSAYISTLIFSSLSFVWVSYYDPVKVDVSFFIYEILLKTHLFLIEILLIGSLGTNFSEILIKICTFSFRKMLLKISSGKFCLCLNVSASITFHRHIQYQYSISRLCRQYGWLSARLQYLHC